MRSSNAQRTTFAVDSLNFNMRDKSELLSLFPTHFLLNHHRMFASLFADQVPKWQQLEETASSSTGTMCASEVPDTQAAAGTSSYFAMFFTFSLASASHVSRTLSLIFPPARSNCMSHDHLCVFSCPGSFDFLKSTSFSGAVYRSTTCCLGF